MDMVSAHMAPYHLDIHACTYLPYDLSQPHPNVLADHRLAVFGYPNHVILDIIDRMRSLAILFHARPLFGDQSIAKKLLKQFRLKAKVSTGNVEQ